MADTNDIALVASLFTLLPDTPESAEALLNARKWLQENQIDFLLIGDTAIVCMTCGTKSYNRNDVLNLYCGSCHKFHGEI